DLGGRWPARLGAATAAEKRLSFFAWGIPAALARYAAAVAVCTLERFRLAGASGMFRRCACVIVLEMRTVFALVLLVTVVSSAHARKQCDTTYTSDLRRIWQCDDVCVHIFGNPPYYIAFDGVRDGKIVRPGTFEWKKNADTASLNGKRCKQLPQSQD